MNILSIICFYIFQFELGLFDTAGLEDYDRLRPLSYPNSDVAVIAFSIYSPWSLENVPEKWTPEIRHHLPNAPIVLVATKSDIRSDPNTHRELAKMRQTPVIYEEGHAMARKIEACAFLECSAKKNEGVREVFETIVRAADVKNRKNYQEKYSEFI